MATTTNPMVCCYATLQQLEATRHRPHPPAPSSASFETQPPSTCSLRVLLLSSSLRNESFLWMIPKWWKYLSCGEKIINNNEFFLFVIPCIQKVNFLDPFSSCLNMNGNWMSCFDWWVKIDLLLANLFLLVQRWMTVLTMIDILGGGWLVRSIFLPKKSQQCRIGIRYFYRVHLLAVAIG